MKDKVTAQNVSSIIQQSMRGEYDQYHDWSPSYSLSAKVNLLENMLNERNLTENEAKKVVVQFIRSLVKESGNHFCDITNLLVNFIHLPEIIKVGNEHIISGIFSNDLLAAMKNKGIKQDEWLLKISTNLKEKKFIVDKRIVNTKELYNNIQKLVSELSTR